MPVQSKVFTYQIDGLSYIVTLYEQDGSFFSDITVVEGAMDVNAVYFGDDEFSGSSENLDGPLNMNGTRLDGERIQWDEAVALSDPGLGPEGEDKETYLQAGDTLTLELDIDSLDEVDIFGIRATSTTNDAGSIKAVSDDPEEPEEPEDPQDPTYEKLFFGEVFSDAGDPLGGTFILSEEPDPNPYSIPSLPEGTDPTFENYVSYYLSDAIGGDLSSLEGVVFYQTGEDGTQEEVFRIDAPEGGFQDPEDLFAAYEDALETQDLPAGTEGESLIMALSIEDASEDLAPEAEEETTEELELI
ncbi:hypothetical protein [Phaeobacter italicus]|jgi:hypothetical protein|uniref:hypothetical protein n=1 Tax=Phaeobacter italicus TaxID=481446 RepID=UPI001CD1D6BC|nr:hypothetical protein [Phaeobacter italicus]MCA0856704.1 hypothetical protein [Phaeobacter italicus]